MSKVERLVNLIALLLETRHPLTMDEIVELVPGYEGQAETLRRMFERDKEELRALGVPIARVPVDVWGAEEGYSIDQAAYQMPDLDLAPDERAALELAARVWWGGGDPATRAGLAKLDLDPAWTPAPVAADLQGTSPVLGALLDAVRERKAVGFTYRPPGRPPAVRRVDPYALVSRRAIWYVVGRDHDRDAPRSFRLSRIESRVRRLRTARGPDFDLPAGFNPGSVLPVAGERPVREAAVVRVPEPAAGLARARGAEEAGPADGQGAVLRVPFDEASDLVAWAVGSGAEILEPVELRTAARERLAGLVSALDSTASPAGSPVPAGDPRGRID